MKKLSLFIGIVLVAFMSISFSEGSNTNNHKVYVCHIPPGNPANMHTIYISWRAVAAHEAHGCYIGFCE